MVEQVEPPSDIALLAFSTIQIGWTEQRSEEKHPEMHPEN